MELFCIDWQLKVLNAFIQTISKQDGKDKLLKSIQYLARIITMGMQAKRMKPLDALPSRLSLTRRTFRLGCWLKDVRLVRNCRKNELFFLLVDISNSILDDICCIYKLEFIQSKWIYQVADLYSSRLWLISIIHDIYQINNKIHTEAIEDDGLAEKQFKTTLVTWLSLLKAYFDFAFCTYEVTLTSFSPRFQQICGMMGAIIGLLKLINKEMS